MPASGLGQVTTPVVLLMVMPLGASPSEYVSGFESLAETLKDSAFLPRDIAMSLANDIDQIALPVLQFSTVLTDQDLIDIVRSGSPGKQVAIAGRPVVSTEVAGELLQTDNSLAVARLVANPGAHLNDELIEKAATFLLRSTGRRKPQ